jgi:hypothetical protein
MRDRVALFWGRAKAQPPMDLGVALVDSWYV